MSVDAVLTLDSVTFRRAGNEIVRDVDLRVRPGEHWALLGPNGAGKSTLLSLCGGWAHPTSGTVDVLGHRIGRVELQALRRLIGHVDPRHPLTSSLSVRDVVLTGFTGSIELMMRWSPSPAQEGRADELVALVGLEHRRTAPWTVLSQGERGRALIARALVSEPRLLLLDEPATGLDLAAREQLLSTISGLEREVPDLATVLVTHHLEELPVSTTHAVLLAAGEIVVAGPVGDVLTSEQISRTFGHPVEVNRTGGRWHARAQEVVDHGAGPARRSTPAGVGSQG